MSITYIHNMKISCQFPASAALTQEGRTPGIHWNGGWMRLVQGILILISTNTLICSPVALLGFTAT